MVAFGELKPLLFVTKYTPTIKSKLQIQTHEIRNAPSDNGSDEIQVNCTVHTFNKCLNSMFVRLR